MTFGGPATFSSLLISGFEPFLGEPENVSRLVARAVAERLRLKAVIIPVEYERAPKILTFTVKEIGPKGVLLLGQSSKAKAITFERFAYSVDDCEHPDEAGVKRVESREGEKRIESPIYPLVSAIPGLEMSEDPGRFLCNHSYYRVMREFPELGVGFVHLPSLESPEGKRPEDYVRWSEQFIAPVCALAEMITRRV